MKSKLIFLYGIIAYLLFLGTFLYAIGFVGNILVPKSIDVGGDTSIGFWTGLLINALLLSVFALQHSVMARPGFKRWWTKVIPVEMERSTYVLFASLALILLYWLWTPMTDIIWDFSGTAVGTVLSFLFVLGWVIVLLATFMINHFELFGLQQIYNNLIRREAPPMSFQARYLYAVVRHPIMLGFLIAFWAAPVMTLGHLFFSLMTTGYIVIAVKFFEERDLRNSMGEVYVDYIKKEPMFLPSGKRYKTGDAGLVVENEN